MYMYTEWYSKLDVCKANLWCPDLSIFSAKFQRNFAVL